MKKMISRRNFLKVAGASAAALGLAACGGSSSSTAASTAGSTAASAAPAAAGKVYYLNFKPEQDQAWQDLAASYTKQTGVPVTVVTAASGQYETTLMSEMEKSEAPTLFQVNGPVGLANWKDYCLDLSGSDVYGQLTSDSFALKDGDAVTSIAYVIETYGIIYNKELTEQQKDDYVAGKTIEIKEVPNKNGSGTYTDYVKFDCDKMQPRSYRNNPDLKQAKVQIPTNENKVQVAVNEQGKTNEATKHTKEPLSPGQSAPKNEKQQKEQNAEEQKPKRKARSVKM